MMKRLIHILPLFFFGFMVLAVQFEGLRDDLQRKPPKVKRATGTKENPGARSMYEFTMLADPATGAVPAGIRSRELAFAQTLPKDEDLALFKGTQVVRAQGLTYTRRGPWNVGGRTRALALDATNEAIILAGGVSGGMWRSTNSGAAWTKTTNSLDLHSVSCIAQNTKAGGTNIWWYGTGELTGNSASATGASYRGDGIFKSTDGGVSWALLPSTVSNTPHVLNDFDYVTSLAFDATNAAQDELYAAIPGAIVRSTNGGDTWTRVLGLRISEAGTKAYFTDAAITSTGVLYAALSRADLSGGYNGNSAGIWRSADGLSWTNITPAGWPAQTRRIVPSIAPSSENIVYFLAETPGSGKQNAGDGEWVSLWKYQYLSGDGSGAGGSWTDLSVNIPMKGQPVGDFNTQGSYNLVMKVKTDDPNTVLTGATNLYRSTDGYTTQINPAWIGGYSTANDINIYANHHPDQHGMAFLPSNSNVLISSHDGGISRTSNVLANPVAWTSLNNGYFTTQFYHISVERKTNARIDLLGGMQDNGTWGGRSPFLTAGWTDWLGGDGSYSAMSLTTNSLYCSWQNGGIYRFVVDASLNYTGWTRVDPTRATNAPAYLFINPFILDRNDERILYVAGGTRIWRNSNATQIALFSNNTAVTNWTELTNSAVPSGTISALAVSTSPANVLFYGTSARTIFRLNDAHTGNPTAVNITSSIGVASGYVSSISVDPTDANKVMIAYSNYGVISIWHTEDALAASPSWVQVAGNLEAAPDGSGAGPSVRSVFIMPVGTARVYFAATSTGLYATNQLNGASTVWYQQAPSVIGNVVVTGLDGRYSDGFLGIGTHGAGTFSATVNDAGLVSVSDPKTFPSTFVLSQNYPNPFNPVTVISYSLPQGSAVSLELFNMSGQRVAVLDEGFRSAGTHTVRFNGRNLPSGVYLYRLNAGAWQAERKMVLMK